MHFVLNVAPWTRGDFVTPEKAVRDRPQDVQGAEDAGNFAFSHVGDAYGYSMPFLRMGSAAAALTFGANDPFADVVRDEFLRDQQVITGARGCKVP